MENIKVIVRETGTIHFRLTPSGQAVLFKVDKFVGDGMRTEFGLAATAMSNSYLVLLNGIPQEEGNEYTMNPSSNVITFIIAPKTTWKIEVRYAIVS